MFLFEQSIIFSEKIVPKKAQFTSPQYIYKTHIQVSITWLIFYRVVQVYCCLWKGEQTSPGRFKGGQPFCRDVNRTEEHELVRFSQKRDGRVRVHRSQRGPAQSMGENVEGHFADPTRLFKGHSEPDRVSERENERIVSIGEASLPRPGWLASTVNWPPFFLTGFIQGELNNVGPLGYKAESCLGHPVFLWWLWNFWINNNAF